MASGPRLRQVALVVRDLAPAADRLGELLGAGDPYRDPIVAEFGLDNAVFTAGDTFVEVLAPVRPDAPAARFLERHGCDGGYMAIFQVPDMGRARARLADLGVRVVWQKDFPDLAGTHLHPKDVPGAIVSLDWAEPPESWGWGGPAWRGGVPPHPPGGITGITLDVAEPAVVASRWADVLGTTAGTAGDNGDQATVTCGGGAQRLRFRSARGGTPVGITELLVALPERASRAELRFGSVRLVVTPDPEELP